MPFSHLAMAALTVATPQQRLTATMMLRLADARHAAGLQILARASPILASSMPQVHGDQIADSCQKRQLVDDPDPPHTKLFVKTNSWAEAATLF